jgi:RNA polymerase primary sigma factor
LRKVDRFAEAIEESLPAEAVIAVTAEEIDLSTNDVRELMRIPRKAIPFEESDADDPDMECAQYRDYLAFQRTKIIEDILATLPERAENVIVRRFGFRGEEEMTLEELGTVYGVTRERIRQIESKSLTEIGHPSRQRLLLDLR